MRQLATTANANANVDAEAETTGVNIRFDDICWTAPNGKTIMYKVSGEFRAGRMTAIMGPSGAGKSTIIALITGKSKRNSGSVTVNGAEVATLGDHPECTGKVGFVPQEDVMLRDLSASENIAFSARYRLPPSLSAAEVEEKINETIDVLELEKVRDDIVGDERTRGISGGQRKRVNVGIELVTEPKVLFLDEPTSGLDSTKSRRLCKILQEVTRRRNMTVAAVIHQPSREAFDMFDDLLLLGAGGRSAPVWL
jgi:ABC-type multidrug transport system ATPase subunit